MAFIDVKKLDKDYKVNHMKTLNNIKQVKFKSIEFGKNSFFSMIKNKKSSFSNFATENSVNNSISYKTFPTMR